MTQLITFYDAAGVVVSTAPASVDARLPARDRANDAAMQAAKAADWRIVQAQVTAGGRVLACYGYTASGRPTCLDVIAATGAAR